MGNGWWFGLKSGAGQTKPTRLRCGFAGTRLFYLRGRAEYVI